MALIKTPSDYNRTGGNWFTRASNATSYIPFGIGAALAWPLGMIGTAIDSGKWLIRGKVASAITAAGAGAVATTVNSAGSIVGANIASGVLTGKTLGTHARKGTEVVTGGVLGVVNMKPQVLQSYTAGIGSIGGGAAPAGPGRYVSQVAASRGEDPNVAYARLQSGQPDHMAALQSAQQSSLSR